MVDTLQMTFTDYRVRPGHKLTIQPAAFTPSTGEVHSSALLWEGCEAAKAYHNAERFNFEVKSLNGRALAMCHLSVPRYARGTNVDPVGADVAGGVLSDLQRQLDDVGVGCDVMGAKVSRLDAFQNIRTKEPFAAYEPVLSLLEGKRTKNAVDYGGTGFLWRNTLHSFIAYDKVAEQRVAGNDVGRFAGSNLLRFEYRSMRAATVAKDYGFSSVGDLLHGYDTVRDVYRKKMCDGLFRYEPGEAVEVLSRQRLFDEMQLFREQFGRRWLAAYWRQVGLRDILQRATPDMVADVVKELSGDKMRASRARRMLYDAMVHEKLLQRDPLTLRTLGDLYRELHQGVLAA